MPKNDKNRTKGFTIISDPRQCRIAYTINNWQPVSCTLIGDQPLFYLDADIIDDDAAETDLVLAQLESLLEESGMMQEPLSSLRARSQRHENDLQQLCHFHDGGASAPHPVTGQDTSFFLEKLQETHLGRAYATFIAAENIVFKTATWVENAFYDRDRKTILIHPGLDPLMAQLSVMRELRTAWQHYQGILIDPSLLYPDQAIVLNRLLAADRTISMVRYAWDMKIAGTSEIWDYLNNGPLQDLCLIMARTAGRDFRHLMNGKACRAVLEAWFLSERCRRYDRQLIQRLLSAQKNGEARLAQPGYSLSVLRDITAKIGMMPLGENYAQGLLDILTNDPLFTEVRDRSNANFLWFIKFEHSFTEAEQNLQSTEKTINLTSSQSGDYSHNVKDTHDQKIRQIPAVFRRRRGDSERQDASDDGSVGNILYFAPRQQ